MSLLKTVREHFRASEIPATKTGYTLGHGPKSESPDDNVVNMFGDDSASGRPEDYVPPENLEILAQNIVAFQSDLGDLETAKSDLAAERAEEDRQTDRKRRSEDDHITECQRDTLYKLNTARDVWKQRFNSLFEGVDPQTLQPIPDDPETYLCQMDELTPPPVPLDEQ